MKKSVVAIMVPRDATPVFIMSELLTGKGQLINKVIVNINT